MSKTGLFNAANGISILFNSFFRQYSFYLFAAFVFKLFSLEAAQVAPPASLQSISWAPVQLRLVGGERVCINKEFNLARSLQCALRNDANKINFSCHFGAGRLKADAEQLQ